MTSHTDFAQLRAFVAVCEVFSFSRAAEMLGVSPSALSQLIRGLEERVGVRLLNRTTRSVSLTEAGQALIEYAFLEMRLPRLVNGIDDANTPSIRLAEKLGFRRVRNLHPEQGGHAWVLDNHLL